jgi:acetyl esterase/lipase
MKPVAVVFLLVFLAGCGRREGPAPAKVTSAALIPGPEEKVSLPEARQGFQTVIVRKESAEFPLPEPPPRLFRKVQYVSPAGKLGAYLSPNPGDGKKHPAILWITGGDCNTVDDSIWKPAPRDNDQTASAFREAGILMMFPSLRGGNDNPGVREGFFGEVDDVLAAADYLARVDYVDPRRIYLGGHSTGGTLVLLVAASTDRLRAVFSFGPVEDVHGYGRQYCPFNPSNPREYALRSPGRWLHSVKCPTFVFEGTEEPGNLRSLQALAAASHNPLVHTYPVRGANHFSILYPVTRLIARKVLRDEGPATNLAFTEEELSQSVGP